MPDAIYQSVLQATSQLARAGTTGISAVYRRRKPVLLEADTVPCVIVSPGVDGERIVFETFGGQVVYGYPVTCLVVSSGITIKTAAVQNPEAADTTADTATEQHLLARESLRNAVYKRTLSGVSSVFNGEIVMGQPVTVAGGGQSLYMLSAMTVTYWSLETHTW